MARTNAHTTTKLSTLIQDPFVRTAFEHAERDLGDEQAAMAEVDQGRERGRKGRERVVDRDGL